MNIMHPLSALARKMDSIDFTEHICVLVGIEKQSFTVHKNLICRRSTFFKTALSERWKTENVGKIELPDDEPEVFAAYLSCAYKDDCSNLESSTRFSDFTNLYILADKLGDLGIANDTIDRIIRLSDRVNAIPSLCHICETYERTTPPSPLRKLLVDFHLLEGAQPAFADLDEDTVPPAFAIQFMKRYREVKVDDESSTLSQTFWKRVKDMDKCTYHQHDESCPPCDEGTK